MKVRVKGHTQVNHEGLVYGPGEVFEASDEQAGYYERIGLADPVTASTRKRRLVEDKAPKRGRAKSR